MREVILSEDKQIQISEDGKLLNCGIDPEEEESFRQPVVLIKEHEHYSSSAGAIGTLTLPVGTMGFLDIFPMAFEGAVAKELVCSVELHFKLGDVKASATCFVPVASLLKLDRSEVPREFRLKG